MRPDASFFDPATQDTLPGAIRPERRDTDAGEPRFAVNADGLQRARGARVTDHPATLEFNVPSPTLTGLGRIDRGTERGDGKPAAALTAVFCLI